MDIIYADPEILNYVAQMVGAAASSETDYVFVQTRDKLGNPLIADLVYQFDTPYQTYFYYAGMGKTSGISSLPVALGSWATQFRVSAPPVQEADLTDSLLPTPDCTDEQSQIENLLLAMEAFQTRYDELVAERDALLAQSSTNGADLSALEGDLATLTEDLNICEAALQQCANDLAQTAADRDAMSQALTKCKKSESDLIAELDTLRSRPPQSMDMDAMMIVLGELGYIQQRMEFLQGLNMVLLNSMMQGRDGDGINIYVDNAAPPMRAPAPSPPPPSSGRPLFSHSSGLAFSRPGGNDSWMKYVIAAAVGMAGAWILSK